MISHGPKRKSAEQYTPTICHLIHSLNVGGAEVLASGLARSLKAQFRFVFACLDELGPLGQDLREQGFLVEVIGREPGVDWFCSRRLRKFCRRERVRVIHAHQYTPFLQALLSRLPIGRLNVLFTEHGRHFPDSRKPRRVAANRLLLRKSDRMVGVGESVRQALVNNEGLPENRIELIYNGVDLNNYERRDRLNGSFDLRQHLSIENTQPIVITVARLHPSKDHSTGIQAIRHLHDRGRKVHWVLVGDGPEADHLQQEVANQTLGEFIHFLGTRNDVPELLPQADVFLLPSITEGIPLTVIEAMAARVPVVATQVGGLPEMIEHQVNGLLVPSRDSLAIADALEAILNSPDETTAMTNVAREIACRKFSLSSMTRAYREIYEELTCS